jgi:hypothetical protein
MSMTELRERDLTEEREHRLGAEPDRTALEKGN